MFGRLATGMAQAGQPTRELRHAHDTTALSEPDSGVPRALPMLLASQLTPGTGRASDAQF